MEAKFAKKITRATVRSFIRKNTDNLYIKKKSEFNGMVDGKESVRNPLFKKAVVNLQEKESTKYYTEGVNGAWFVGGGRDYFDAYDNGEFVGIEVANCCGNFVIAVPK